MPWMRAQPPFAGLDHVPVVVPRDLDALPAVDAEVLARLPLQLDAEADAIARELGAPPLVVDTPPADGPCWWIGPPEAHATFPDLGAPDVPAHHLDRDQRRLVTSAPDAAGILQAFGALRTLSRHPGGWLEVTDAADLDTVVERVLVEVHDTWAGRLVRDVDWLAHSRQHVWAVRGATHPVHALQRWLTPLGDAHTWVRPVRTQLVLPYGATVIDGEVVLTHVFPWSPGWDHGVRPGWRLVGEDVRGAWQTTPGAPHAKAQWVARRLLSGDPGVPRTLEARGPGARWAHWEETPEYPTGAPASWEVLPSGTGFLWIGAWVPGLGVEETLEEALTELQGCERLIVDLRGNSGGRLAMAQAFRDRFVDRETHVGWIRHTGPGGAVGPAERLVATPSEGVRWTKPVRFLTSPLTYSASEDAMLGLQGLPHVQIVGERTGGGSGRNRRLRLLPGWRLTISGAVTYDPHGRPVEAHGLAPDIPVVPDRRHPTGEDVVLTRADVRW